MPPIRTQLSQKQEAFPQFFLAFSKSTLNFEHFQKKDYALLKTWLDIGPKSPVSKDPLTGNMVNGFKHCCDLNDSTVTIFTDQFEGN